MKLFEEKKKTPWMNKIPQLDSSGFALTVARFESIFFFFFCLLILFIYAKTHVMNEHFV